MRKILAFALMAAVAMPTSQAFALSCAEPSLERLLPSASAVFEGHVVKIERRFLQDAPGRDTSSHLEKATVKIDKPYKGNISAGQEVSVILQVWMPLWEGMKDWPEKEGDEQKGLFILGSADPKIIDLAKMDGPVYFSGMCDQLVHEASPENLKFVEQASVKP